LRSAAEASRLATESGQLAVRERASRLLSDPDGEAVEAQAMA
jgi:hypothetical protein